MYWIEGVKDTFGNERSKIFDMYIIYFKSLNWTVQFTHFTMGIKGTVYFVHCFDTYDCFGRLYV